MGAFVADSDKPRRRGPGDVLVGTAARRNAGKCGIVGSTFSGVTDGEDHDADPASEHFR